MATSGDAIIMGGILAFSPATITWAQLFVLFLCAVVIGWVHNTSRAFENAARCMGFSFVIVATLHLASLRLIVPALAGSAWAMLVTWGDHQAPPPICRRNRRQRAQGPARISAVQHAADWRFGLRYAIAAALGLGLAIHFGATHAAWVTITTLAVMRPNDSESVQLVLQRAFGTLIGVGIALADRLAEPQRLASDRGGDHPRLPHLAGHDLAALERLRRDHGDGAGAARHGALERRWRPAVTLRAHLRHRARLRRRAFHHLGDLPEPLAACNRSRHRRAIAAGAWSGTAKHELALISQRT